VAVFVHQDSRRKGLGTNLLKTALEWAAAAGIRRVWGLASSDNRAELRLLTNCGFHQVRFASQEAELEIYLPLP
jgi:GNAT superfamily N-acetyltransferase